MRTQLASLGWTAPRAAVADAQPRAQSEIRYPAANRLAAEALARSLPAPVRLVSCGVDCQGLQLIVGTDLAGWKPKAARRPS